MFKLNLKLNLFGNSKTGITAQEADNITKPITIIKKLKHLLNLSFYTTCFYIFLYGGRSSGKSDSIINILIKYSFYTNKNILCLRFIQNSIAESVKSNIEKYILEYGYNDYFEIQNTRIINKKTGANFLFYGLYTQKNIASIKSMKNVALVFYEEASYINYEAFQIIMDTFEREDVRYFFVYNPINNDDDVKQFQDNIEQLLPNNFYKEQVLYYDNEYLNNRSKNYISKLKIKFYEKYQHYFLGMPISVLGAILKQEFFNEYNNINDIVAKSSLNRIFFITADTALKDKEANDYSVVCLWFLDNKKLYLVDGFREKLKYKELERKYDDFVDNVLQSLNKKYTDYIFKSFEKIEDRGSGTILIQHRKANKKKVREYEPKKFSEKSNNSFAKYNRLNENMDKILDGNVYFPKEKTKFINDFIDECCSFTHDNTHKHDDCVDNLIMALYEIKDKKELFFKPI